MVPNRLFKNTQRIKIFLFLLVLSLPVPSPTPAGQQAFLTYREAMAQENQKGDFESLLAIARQAGALCDEAGTPAAKIEILQEMSLAYIALGQYAKAVEAADIALDIINATGHAGLKTPLFGIKGYALIQSGTTAQGRKDLFDALLLARNEQNEEVIEFLLGYAAKIHILLKEYPQAMASGEEGLMRSGKTARRAAAAGFASDLATTCLLTGNSRAARNYLGIADDHYRTMADSHEKAYGLIGVAKMYQKLAALPPDGSREGLLPAAAAKALFQAQAVADAIGDPRASSFAAGYAGQLYESEKRYQEAIQLTKKALLSARRIRAWEIAYLWEWQLGRLYRVLEQNDQAILAYEQTVETLNSIRQEMLACPNRGGQASSRETLEPIYLQLTDLLLRRAERATSPEQSRTDLLTARTVIESLKAVELQNYFQDPCIADRQPVKRDLEDVAGDTLVVYSIIFQDRLVLLVSGKSWIKMISTSVDAKQLSEEVKTFRLALERPQNPLFAGRGRRIVRLENLKSSGYLDQAQKIYNWILRPLEQDVAEHKINNIVFIPDGALRTIPMAALHDGRQFTIEKMSIVTIPGLGLTDPKPLGRKKVPALIGGVSEGIHGFVPLENVNGELEAVRGIYGGKILKNEDFIQQNLAKELKEHPYEIIHIATHGEFARDISDSYLLSWDGKIDMNQIDRMIRATQYRIEPLELITLSACNTAEGDERAALGLAGVAVKAGARSALATLWSVSDQVASDVVVDFYRQLQNQSVSKAQALQQAQIKILRNQKFSHPFYWSSFLLIGNWL